MQEIILNDLYRAEQKSFKENYTTKEVATNYGVLERTVGMHKDNHDDELIENIHYFYSYEQTKGGRQRIIRWTLEGVYMLGFFIKSPQAKIYRKKVAEFLRLCKERQDAKSEQLRKDYLAIADRNATLEAVAINKQKHFNLQINGYKSQISQKNKLIAKLKESRNFNHFNSIDEKQIIALSKVQKDLELMHSKIGAVMASISGDDWFMKDLGML